MKVFGTKIIIEKKSDFKEKFLIRNATDISIGDDIKEIPNYAFMHCKKLLSCFIEKNVKRIGVSAFEDCENLKSIIIPGNVKKNRRTCFFKLS